MELIRQNFQQVVNLSENDWQLFASKLERFECPKRSILFKTGKTEKYLSFIEKGIVRFYLPRSDYELTFAFVFENAFVSAYDSFLTQTPSTYNVETLADTQLWRIHYNHLQEIYNKSEAGNTIGRFAGEELFLKKSKRELSLLTETAEQRYLKLLNEQPHLVQRIPLKYLSSYIGITPQALSRIRKRIS